MHANSRTMTVAFENKKSGPLKPKIAPKKWPLLWREIKEKRDERLKNGPVFVPRKWARFPARKTAN